MKWPCRSSGGIFHATCLKAKPILCNSLDRNCASPFALNRLPVWVATRNANSEPSAAWKVFCSSSEEGIRVSLDYELGGLQQRVSAGALTSQTKETGVRKKRTSLLGPFLQDLQAGKGSLSLFWTASPKLADPTFFDLVCWSHFWVFRQLESLTRASDRLAFARRVGAQRDATPLQSDSLGVFLGSDLATLLAPHGFIESVHLPSCLYPTHHTAAGLLKTPEAGWCSWESVCCISIFLQMQICKGQGSYRVSDQSQHCSGLNQAAWLTRGER